MDSLRRPDRGETVNQEEYEKDLRRRQQEHFERIQPQARPFQPCMHDGCSSCVGTGIKIDGGSCIHMLACSCPKCSWR